MGTGAVTELLARGHTVVLVSRHADDEAKQWPSGVVARNCDVTDAASLAGVADGCDAVLHVVGIVEEHPPAVTFDAVNVQGTANTIAEAERAGVNRFVYVSSLGAPRGESGYHVSKRRAEAHVRAFRGNWTICRPGNVYGPGDEQISVLLRIVRGASPLVPTIGDGEQQFQPLWWEDASRALALVVERSDLAGRELDIAGREVTSQKDLLERFSRITGRDIRTIPFPERVVALGAKAISLVGWDVGISDAELQMLGEGNVIGADGVNALTDVLDITPTPLDDGLRALTDLQPEQHPAEGVGTLQRKLFWADITGITKTPEEVFELFVTHFNDVTPVFVDANAETGGQGEITDGTTITLALPLRGHVQVRVAVRDERQLTLITLAGHPLAGAVRFLSEQRGHAIRFQVEVFDRAANFIDLVAMRTIGDFLQDRTWKAVVQKMIEQVNGTAVDGVKQFAESMTDDEAARIYTWLDELVVERVRRENAEKIEDATPDRSRST